MKDFTGELGFGLVLIVWGLLGHPLKCVPLSVPKEQLSDLSSYPLTRLMDPEELTMGLQIWCEGVSKCIYPRLSG